MNLVYRHFVRGCILPLLLCLALSNAAQSAAERGTFPQAQQYREWIQAMRTEPRGPFSRIRWFCSDGTVLPPRAYACQPHGGGNQHGEWSEQAQTLRAEGYYIANILAGIDLFQFLGRDTAGDEYAQILIERFLFAVDDGWILHKARFYRGAVQEEGERAGARALLLAMLGDARWIGPGYGKLRAGVRLLPHGADTASIGNVRQWSAALAKEDAPFANLRVKIHGSPEAADAAAVRAYAAKSAPPALQERYEELAAEIDQIYHQKSLSLELQGWQSRALPAGFLQQLAGAESAWPQADAMQRHRISAQLLAASRDVLPEIQAPDLRLQLMDLGLRIEAEHFRASTELQGQLEALTRGQLLTLLGQSAQASYGAGYLNQRLYLSLESQVAGLEAEATTLDGYRQALDDLSRAPGWAVQGMRMGFYESMLKLAQIEPLAILFIQDQLRSSPLLFYSKALDVLLRDAGRIAGIRHSLFGEEIGAGFKALNPGLARGTLRVQASLDNLEQIDPRGIYLLPETISELPPVAGIITAGEGNPLSHVQLLARNLGIPNVTVDPGLREILLKHDGEAVVLAVSPGGLVELESDGPRWDKVFEQEASLSGVTIRPDLDKLDLSVVAPVQLDDLRAADSGRSVGPKAAKLGELRQHYPDAVAGGVAIPFGLFKLQALDRPHPAGGTVFEWMRAGYDALEQMPQGSARAAATEAFRAELYQLILTTPMTEAFRRQLSAALGEAFEAVLPGLFVRSDTNVEDLDGFTGAGLNLTLPNVVGLDALLEAIPRVWASPFTARAFAWRQSHMTDPEHVYTSILLLESVGSDKSGVLVTADLDTGSMDTISVAVNEGLGGAVDGQAAESLRINLEDASVRVLATATAPWRRVLDPAGGVRKLPASGADTVLKAAEISRLALFGRELPQRFPPITDDQGNRAPADVEFGFLDGKLQLFQLRPFLESKAARGSVVLRNMDATAGVNGSQPVLLTEVPLP